MEIRISGKDAADILQQVLEHRYGVTISERTYVAYSVDGNNISRNISKLDIAFKCQSPAKAEVAKAAEDRKIDLNL